MEDEELFKQMSIFLGKGNDYLRIDSSVQELFQWLRKLCQLMIQCHL